ncbi:hypothetical protein GCM10029978_094900 [Actinoallomurus acanthiterrae]
MTASTATGPNGRTVAGIPQRRRFVRSPVITFSLSDLDQIVPEHDARRVPNA